MSHALDAPSAQSMDHPSDVEITSIRARNERRVTGWIIVLSASAVLWTIIGGAIWLITRAVS